MATDTEADELIALDVRDERVRETLIKAIDDRRADAARMRGEADELERTARAIELAVRAEKWWELEWLLGKDDTESLCDWSPAGLLS